jgi:ABC-type glycerol-3-phosphate transport system permease component
MISLKKSHLIFLVVAVILIAVFYFLDYSFLDKKDTVHPTPTHIGKKTENFSTYYDTHQADHTMVPFYCITIIIIIGIVASMRP